MGRFRLWCLLSGVKFGCSRCFVVQRYQLGTERGGGSQNVSCGDRRFPHPPEAWSRLVGLDGFFWFVFYPLAGVCLAHKGTRHTFPAIGRGLFCGVRCLSQQALTARSTRASVSLCPWEYPPRASERSPTFRSSQYTPPFCSLKRRQFYRVQAISLCGRQGMWKEAVFLLRDAQEVSRSTGSRGKGPGQHRGPDVVTFSAAVAACRNGGEWQQALSLMEVCFYIPMYI